MKELKKLSLKEEVDRQAQKIEEEVRNRDDLDDIKVSEDMETSLFNKIQEYEYDKRIKKVVHRSRKKRRLFLALAAVLILVCGSVITGTGSKSYWKVLWERVAGDEEANIVNVEDMDVQETQDLEDVHIYREIWNELGIEVVGWGYFPDNTFLKEYEIDKGQGKAILLYDYDGQVIRYTMYMNDEDSSLGQIKTDEVIDEYPVETADGRELYIKECELDETKTRRYVTSFEYKDAQYQIMGDIQKDEFEKIVKNLIFL